MDAGVSLLYLLQPVILCLEMCYILLVGGCLGLEVKYLALPAVGQIILPSHDAMHFCDLIVQIGDLCTLIL